MFNIRTYGCAFDNISRRIKINREANGSSWPTLLTRPDILPLGFLFWYMRSFHVLDILAVVIVLWNNICDNDLVMIT